MASSCQVKISKRRRERSANSYVTFFIKEKGELHHMNCIDLLGGGGKLHSTFLHKEAKAAYSNHLKTIRKQTNNEHGNNTTQANSDWQTLRKVRLAGKSRALRAWQSASKEAANFLHVAGSSTGREKAHSYVTTRRTTEGGGMYQTVSLKDFMCVADAYEGKFSLKELLI